VSEFVRVGLGLSSSRRGGLGRGKAEALREGGEGGREGGKEGGVSWLI